MLLTGVVSILWLILSSDEISSLPPALARFSTVTSFLTGRDALYDCFLVNDFTPLLPLGLDSSYLNCIRSNFIDKTIVYSHSLYLWLFESFGVFIGCFLVLCFFFSLLYFLLILVSRSSRLSKIRPFIFRIFVCSSFLLPYSFVELRVPSFFFFIVFSPYAFYSNFSE